MIPGRCSGSRSSFVPEGTMPSEEVAAYASELIGTFFLVLTVGLNVLQNQVPLLEKKRRSHQWRLPITVREFRESCSCIQVCKSEDNFGKFLVFKNMLDTLTAHI